MRKQAERVQIVAGAEAPLVPAKRETPKPPERPRPSTITEFSKSTRQTAILLEGQEYAYFLLNGDGNIEYEVDGENREFKVRRTVVDGEERFTMLPTVDDVYPFPIDLEYDADLIDENPDALKIVKVPLFHPTNFAVVVEQVSTLDQADFASMYGHTLSNLFASMYLLESRRMMERELELIEAQIEFKKSLDQPHEEEAEALTMAMRNLMVQPSMDVDYAGMVTTQFCTHSNDLEYESRKIIKWLLSRWGRIVGRENGKWVLDEIMNPEDIDEFLAGDILSRTYGGDKENEIIQNAYLFITACAGLWSPEKQLESIRNYQSQMSEVVVPTDEELKK